mmetsp:Transcript_35170/g.84314  ORF Transcript_35170/g.84314 Transcript_35170/m.84314 type:complete len:226 (+) Transcript_35170:823-1500(+)
MRPVSWRWCLGAQAAAAESGDGHERRLVFGHLLQLLDILLHFEAVCGPGSKNLGRGAGSAHGLAWRSLGHTWRRLFLLLLFLFRGLAIFGRPWGPSLVRLRSRLLLVRPVGRWRRCPQLLRSLCNSLQRLPDAFLRLAREVCWPVRRGQAQHQIHRGHKQHVVDAVVALQRFLQILLQPIRNIDEVPQLALGCGLDRAGEVQHEVSHVGDKLRWIRRLAGHACVA